MSVARRLATWVAAKDGRDSQVAPCGGHRLPWRAVLWEGRHVVADCRGAGEADAVAQALSVALLLDGVEPSTYEAAAACSAALLRGATLQASEVTAGAGIVIDWRTIRSGEVVLQAECAFDLAYLFVALVGPGLALREAQTAVLPEWRPLS